MLVLFTPEKNIPREVEILHELFELGLERLHARKPQFSSIEYEEYLLKIEEKWRGRIYLHQYHELVNKYNLGGKHYRKSDFPFANIEKKNSSSGAHSIKEANELLENIEMIFVSPIFESVSKKGYSSEVDFDITTMEVESRGRLIALGGIKEDNIDKAKNLGYENFAVLGGVWNSVDPIESWKKIKKLVS